MIDWRPIEEMKRPAWVSLVYQSTDGSVQQVEGNVFYDPDLGGDFTRKNGDNYILAQNCEYATHFGPPFGVPDPAPDIEAWSNTGEDSQT